MLQEGRSLRDKQGGKACVHDAALIREVNSSSNVCRVNNNHVLPVNKTYFKPSKTARLLAILDSLAQENELSQNSLGRRLGVSGAMINSYLKELQERNLVTFQARNGKSYRYLLTAEGERLRSDMFAGYSSETIQLYSGLKNHIAEKLRRVGERGLLRLVLFGASETCEVVLSTIHGSDFKIMALVDNDAGKHGVLFQGHVVSPPQILETVKCQAVLITSYGRQNEIHEQLAPLCARRGLEIVRL